MKQALSILADVVGIGPVRHRYPRRRAEDQLAVRLRALGRGRGGAISPARHCRRHHRRRQGGVYARSGELASGKPMDADTLFEHCIQHQVDDRDAAGSAGEEGKLRWDDPVRKFLPSFRMYDPWVTANMQVGDLLVHHSGLPEGAGDLMLWPDRQSIHQPKDVVPDCSYLKPAYSFRAGYGYDNTLLHRGRSGRCRSRRRTLSGTSCVARYSSRSA